MKKERLRALFFVIKDDPGRRNIGMHAASGTYYLFLSLGPLLVLLLSLVPYIPVTEEQLLNTLLGYTPESFQQLVNTMVGEVYRGSVTALSVSLVAELWSAGKFLSGIMRGVGEIYDGERRVGFVRRRIVGALYTIALLLFILGNQLLLLFGERFFALFPALAGVWSFLSAARRLVFFAILTLVNTLLFCYVPQGKQRFLRQMPGALLSAAMWMLFSGLYSRCVEFFALFSIYGSLAIISVSLFWIYYSLYILFLGAWVNTLFDKNVPKRGDAKE